MLGEFGVELAKYGRKSGKQPYALGQASIFKNGKVDAPGSG